MLAEGRSKIWRSFFFGLAGLTSACVSLMTIGLIFAGASEARFDPKTTVGIWFFDEGKGDIAGESSGNSNHGQLDGPEWVQGKFGAALSFDGIDDYVLVEHSDSLHFDTGPFTVAMWSKPGSIPASGNHWLYDKAEMRAGWPHNPTRLCFGFRDGRIDAAAGGNWGNFSVSVSVDQWYHLAIVRDGDKMTLYIDGNVQATVAGYGAFFYRNSEPLIFGTRCDRNIGGIYNFNGVIDEVLIANTALTASEINGIVAGLSAVEPMSKFTTTWASLRK